MEDLINKARSRHGDLYDYSKVSSTYDGHSASIICARHGEFKQVMSSHINGTHCKTCSIEKRSKKLRLPTSEFLRRANILHDGKYDYSKVKYNNNRDRVIIICPKHGEFEQILLGHLTGYGCRKCAREASFTTNEEFVRRCEIKHERYYNYSKVNYTDSRNKVTIICPKHGEFEQTAAAHLKGSKCPKCSIEDRYLTTEQFIEKARKVHDDLYSYSDVNYAGARTKVLITCSEHGNFSQEPNSHLNGNGCPVCAWENMHLTQEEFIDKAVLIHDDKFKYDKVSYYDTSTAVTITCDVHGDFTQLPNTHLSGAGCYRCGRDGLKFTKEQFIEKARSVHRDRYDYSKLEYVNIKTKLLITCPEHGDFLQKAATHLRGSGCFKCNASKGELAVEYILINENIKHIREYTLPEIVNRYRYDFYLPEYRALIEFHGIQHYESVEWFGGEEVFDYTRRNDEIKRQLASEAKYVLIELNYKQLETLSSEEFKKLLLKKLAKINKR